VTDLPEITVTAEVAQQLTATRVVCDRFGSRDNCTYDPERHGWGDMPDHNHRTIPNPPAVFHVVVDQAPEVPCPSCKGKRTVRTITPMEEGGVEMAARCPSCGGSGSVPAERVRLVQVCPDCGGAGRRKRTIPGVPPSVCVADGPCRRCWPEDVFWRPDYAGTLPLGTATIDERWPVVDGNGDDDTWEHAPGKHVVVWEDAVRIYDGGSLWATVTDEPWASSLTPGGWLLVLSGYQAREDTT
jgi:hypothetical protein